MVFKPIGDDELKRRADAYIKNGRNLNATAKELGLEKCRARLRQQLTKAAEKGYLEYYKGLPNPSKNPLIEQTIAQHKDNFERLKKHEEHVFRFDLDDDLPFGLIALGDPHLDNQGTDLVAWERWNEPLRTNPRLRGVCLGDLLDNWVGRLESLWAHNPMTKDQAVQILEHYLQEYGGCWDWCVGGNHDKWPDAARAIAMLLEQVGCEYKADEMKIEYHTPSGHVVAVTARHNWPGKSMYNPAHGTNRAAMMRGYVEDLLLGGDLHVSGANQVKSPANGVFTHGVQLASFKIVDDYAKTMGFADKHISPAAVIVIDPQLPRTAHNRVRVFWDLEDGLAVLNWAYKKAKKDLSS
jgi:hypothetical protein